MVKIYITAPLAPPPGRPGQVQDLQDHLQDLQNHLQDHLQTTSRTSRTAWFISNFHRTLKCPVLGLLKTYSIFNKTVSLLVAF